MEHFTFYKTMLSYCLKCRKNTESKKPKVWKKEGQRFYQNMQCVTEKSQDLLKRKKLVAY